MSPVNIPELPTGDTGLNPSLFYPEMSAPFQDEGLSLYEQETSDPYKETFPSDLVSGQGDIAFELPQTVTPQPQEEGALARYLREKGEVDEANRQARVTAERSNELVQRDYVERRKALDLSMNEIISLNQADTEFKKQKFNEDFGWLGGNQHPGWSAFKSEYYPNFDELQPEQKVEALNYWQNSIAKYYVGYGNADPQEIGAKIDDVLIKNTDLIDAEITSAANRIKRSGYNAPGIGTGTDPSGIASFDTTRSGIFAANTLEDLKRKFQFAEDIKKNFPEVVNPDGSFNQEAYSKVFAEQRSLMPTRDEYASEEEYNKAIDEYQASRGPFASLGEDPKKTLMDTVGAYKDLNRMAQLQMLKVSPRVQEVLSGTKRSIDPITGTTKERQLSSFEKAKEILFQAGDLMGFAGGMTLAQQADILEETAAGIFIGAGTNPLAASAISTTASGMQEAGLVASELFQKTMRDNGLDPFNLDDWRKAYDGGVVEEAIREGERKGELKGLTTSSVGGALEYLINLGIRRIPILGGTAKGLLGVGRRMATSVPLSMASEFVSEGAGQGVAFGEFDMRQMMVEGLMGGAGALAFQAPAEVSKVAGERIFGKPKTEAAAPVIEAESVPYNETARPKTAEEIAVEKEQARRNVQSPETTGTPPKGTVSATQEDGSEVLPTDRNVTDGSQQGVASPARESAEAILNPDTPTTTRTAVSLEQRTQELDSLIENLAREEERFRQSPESLRLLNQDLALQEAGTTTEELAAQRLPSTEPRVALPGQGGVATQLYDYGTPVGNILTNYGPIDMAILAPGPIAKPVVNDPLREAIDTEDGYGIIEQMIAAAMKVEERLPKPEPLPEVAFETPAPQQLLESFKQDNATLPEKAQKAWTDEVYTKVQAYFETGDEANLDGLNDIQKRRAKTHLNAAPEAAEAQARGMSVDELARRKQSQRGFLSVPNIEGVQQAAIKTWAKAKDFAGWATQMVNQFGKAITPHLKNLWNDLNSLIRNVGDFFTYTPSAKEKGSVDIRQQVIQSNPQVGKNQTRASLIRKVEGFFGGTIPANVTFVNDRSDGNKFVARIDQTITGQGNIIINEAYADNSNIDSALYEEIGHFASNRGMLTDFYGSLTPQERADVDAAVDMYGQSEARLAETSVRMLQAEERLAKSFAVLASRNKTLWQKIKNLVNKILASLGMAKANTDNQVADIFLRAMTAYKNQRENRPDFSNRRISTQNRTSLYSKPTARQEIDKSMDRIKESKDSPIRSLFQSINLSYLSKGARKELQDRMKAYADATKAIVRGTEIKDPQESKQRFDELVQYLSDTKKLTWENQFKKLQEKYPSSLQGKTAENLKSEKEVMAYVINLNNAESQAIINAQQEKADRKAARTEDKDIEAGNQVTLAIEAQSRINDILDTAPYKEMPAEHKIWTMEAMEYLETLDPATQTQRQNEALVATINSAIDGNIIGFGKYTAARRIQMFAIELDAYVKANGGKIPWYTAAETRRIRRGIENFVSSEKTSKFFKKEAIERMIFSHPELRNMWIRNLGDYLEKVQTENSSLQNELDKRLQASFEKHGLKDKTFAGNVRDKELFSDKARKSKARMMIAAMITQWTDGSNDPIAEINKAITDTFVGIGNEMKYSAFSGARAASNLDSFNSIIDPLIRDGFLIRNGDSFEVQATPEVWNDAVLNVLKDNERNALIEVRDTASLLQDRLKFTKEFWYGEEFEPVVNYVPKQAYNSSPEAKEDPAPELNESSSASIPDNPSLRRQGSVLFARQGLGEKQYYSLDIERAATKAVKTAAYEVTTAPERIMMNEALKNESLLPYFGNEDKSRESRRTRMKEMLKAIHKAEMHIGTAPKGSTSTGGIALEKFGEMATTFLGAAMLGKVKNIFSQYAAPIASSTVIAGKDIYDGMTQLIYNDEWNANDSAAKKRLYAFGLPDLEHRSETIDFFYDISSNTDTIRDVAKVSLDEKLTDEQKTDVIIAKLMAAVDAGVNVPKYISQIVNTKPDAWAAKHVFPGLLINRLKEAGVITKADQFLPAVMNDPRTADAIAKAKQDMSVAFGNANRYSLRPEFFVDKSKNALIRNTLFSIMQTATSMAGDTIVAAKDASYFNTSDKYASQIRKEGAKRLASIALQSYIFAFVSKVVTLQVLKYGALLFGKAEGLDEEEERALRTRIATSSELGMQDINQRALSDMLANMTGFLGTNSGLGFIPDKASKMVMEKLLYADYEEKKKELETAIKKEKNPSKKADLQLQLEIIKRGKEKLSSVFDEPDFGPTAESIINIARSIDDPTQADFDALAEAYYKRGGLEKKPNRNEALRYLGKAAGFVIPDIGAARKEVYRARKEVGDKRKQRLGAESQKGKKQIEKINVPRISYP